MTKNKNLKLILYIAFGHFWCILATARLGDTHLTGTDLEFQIALPECPRITNVFLKVIPRV